MKTIVVSGGNSGIGFEAVRQLTALGHHVVMLGRDEKKGRVAAAGLTGNSGKAEFLAVDLSTHDGVRSAAATLLSAHERIDVLLHTSGVLMMKDLRTTDGLHPFFAVNFLSRYHLTQRLLPSLRKSESPRVIFMTSNVPLDTKIDFALFPRFSPFVFSKMSMPIQIGNHHYAAHLRDTEKWLLAGVVNPGAARTGIWREAALWARLFAAVLGPFLFDSVASSAKNPVELSVADHWPSGSYWLKVGKIEQVTPIVLDSRDTERVIAICRELTGA